MKKPNTSTQNIADYNRILWRAHRGMLELDLFLIPFVEKNWQSLSDSDKQQFENLLQATDPELFAWLMGHEVPMNMEFQTLVKRIRDAKLTAT